MASKNNQPDRPLGLPTVEETTQNQIATLLSTANVLAQFVLAPQRAPWNDSPENRPELDGGVKCAVENAITTVCQRIEAIANDPLRWKVTNIGKIEKALVGAINADKCAHEMHAMALAARGAPHVVMRAAVGLHRQTNRWICVVPDSLMLNGDPLVGQGSTPEEACADFDKQFYEQQAKPKAVDPARAGHPESLPNSAPRSREPGLQSDGSVSSSKVGTPSEGSKDGGEKPTRRRVTRKRKPSRPSDV